jgi:hypothetical protein
MNKNIDLTEILKECPKGIKLYSRCLGSVEFCKITLDNYIEVIGRNGYYIGFKPNGIYQHSEESAEIDLFPSKDQKDWSKWHRPFKDGDIVATNDGKYIAIIKNNGGKYYVCCHTNVNYFNIDRSGWFDRLATEEEKEKLFQYIKDNGYKWNAETKTLDKLIVPKFKVGDKIRHKLTGNVHKVLFVLSNGYNGGVYDVAITNEIGKSIDIKEQDNYELVPNKFDIKTLKPFDKVLVRDFSNQKWTACLFSHIDNDAYHQFKTATALGWYHCIPFNEDTKHLVGKMDEAPEFYRYWDE